MTFRGRLWGLGAVGRDPPLSPLAGSPGPQWPPLVPEHHVVP